MTATRMDTVALSFPVTVGESEIRSVVVRKPMAGDLRRLSLASLLNMDVDHLVKLLPRITEPKLMSAHFEQLDPADLTQLGTKVIEYLVGKQAFEDERALIKAEEMEDAEVIPPSSGKA